MFFYFDPLYFYIVIITLVISTGAQLFIKSSYSKWSKVQNGAGLTGEHVGYAIVNRTELGGSPMPSGGMTSSARQELMRLASLRDSGVITDEEFRAKQVQFQRQGGGDTAVNSSSIGFERVGGNLTDHYDPRGHVVRMSDGVAQKTSVSAMAIVAHELGHAQQHENGSILITMRNFLLPAVRVSPQISYFLIFIGLIFNFVGALWLGILFFGLMVLFSILTLPVEIDASRRGRKLLREAGFMLTPEDEQGSKQVLIAAASTYVAAAVTSILQLLYYISLANRRS